MALLEGLQSASPAKWVLCLLGIVFLALVARRIQVDYLIRKAGGVRAPVVASNVFTASHIIAGIGRAQLNNRLLDAFNDLLVRYGTAASPRCVEITVTGVHRYLLTSEPEHIKAVLTTQFTDFGKGPQFHEQWSPFLGDSIFTTDGRVWQDCRSLIRPMFIKDRVRDLAIFERWTDLLISKLPEPGTTVDIMDLFYRMTLDVTTDFLLGESVNSLENPKHQFAHAFNEVQRVQMLLTILAPFAAFIPKFSYYRGIQAIETFIVPYIEQALALPPEELSKLSKSDKAFTFLHNIARFTRDPKVIRDQIIAVLLAGRDTTAATLSWTMYELAHNPAAYGRLRGEVLATVGPRRTPTYEDLKTMSYLSHALNETLRLYPAVPFNVRAALADTTLPGRPGQPDIVLLKGDAVIYSTLAMQRRAELYPPAGPGLASPAVWSPERWESWAPRPWQYVPFNGGPRICVGQNFAMTEMAFCLVRLLQRYERIEYRGNWDAQFLKTEIVGTPGHGVPIALFEADEGDIA